MNRIAILEADLRHGAASLKRKRRAPAARPAPVGTTGPAAPPASVAAPPSPGAPPVTSPAGAPPGSVSRSVATAMAVWMGQSGAQRRRSASRRASGPSRARSVALALKLDYRVPNLPLPLKQPSSMSCWATVATMMASWRDQKSYQLIHYIGGLGEPWTSKLAKDEGLTSSEAPLLLATMGLQVETAPMNTTAEAWERMLRDYGPLWVTADHNAQTGIQGVHAHILVGIHGPSDGDPNVDVIDPALGSEVQMPFSTLVARYEQLAPTNYAGLQIRHWPAGAQRAAQQSLAWARQESARLAREHGGPVAAVVAAADLSWTVLKDAATGDNDLKWTRATMRGTRVPGDDPRKQALKAGDYHPRSFKTRQRLEFDDVVAADNVGAEFEIRYSYNGHCVSEVTITNTSFAPPRWLSSRDLKVETDIRPAPGYERGDVAAVEVEIVYQFSNLRGSQGTYTDRFILFGNGKELATGSKA